MKRIIALLVIVTAAAGAAFASVEMDLALGGQMTYGNIEISEQTTSFDFAVDAELDMDFGRGQGMMIGVMPTKSDISISVGYAFQTDIGSNCEFLLGAGATMVLGGQFGLNYFASFDFDFNLTPDMFFRVGTGVQIDMGSFDNYGKEWKIIIPLPAFAFGWHF